MFKLVVLSALLAIAAARPGLLAPAFYNTAVVGSLPTTISHQSNSIVHSAALVAPAIHAAPLIANPHAGPLIAGPILTSYAAPALIGHGLLAHH